MDKLNQHWDAGGAASVPTSMLGWLSWVSPLRLLLTAGQGHAILMAPALVIDLEYQALLADRVYGTQA